MDKEYIVCSNYPKCLCGFCYDCLRDKFGQQIDKPPKKWICLVCQRICRCERCIEKFEGESKEQSKAVAVDRPKKSAKNASKETIQVTEKSDSKNIKSSSKKHEEKATNKNAPKESKPIKDTKSNDDTKKPKKGEKKLPIKETQKAKKPSKEDAEPIGGKRKKEPQTKNVESNKKKAKETVSGGNIVKIPMRQPQQAMPAQSIPRMQNPYLQFSDVQTQGQHNQQMSYMLMPQQVPIDGAQYNQLMVPDNRSFVALQMPQQANPMVQKEIQQEVPLNSGKERGKRKKKAEVNNKEI